MNEQAIKIVNPIFIKNTTIKLNYIVIVKAVNLLFSALAYKETLGNFT